MCARCAPALARSSDCCQFLNMASTDETRSKNLQAYRRLKGSLGQTYGRGRFVAICAGRVAADAATFSELRLRLLQLGADLSDALIVEADVDYPEEAVIYSCGLTHSRPWALATALWASW